MTPSSVVAITASADDSTIAADRSAGPPATEAPPDLPLLATRPSPPMDIDST
jgi:hypothetical protein